MNLTEDGNCFESVAFWLENFQGLDHPERVKKLAVLDILPVAEVWDRADRHIIDFWPWSLLAQTAPLPERLIAGAPDAIVNNAFYDWGTDEFVFTSEAMPGDR
jgi:haloacetate dehalogenase